MYYVGVVWVAAFVGIIKKRSNFYGHKYVSCGWWDTSVSFVWHIDMYRVYGGTDAYQTGDGIVDYVVKG